MSQNDSQTNSNSADPVVPRYFLALDGVEIEYNEVKCPSEKKVTPHQWFMIHVGDNFGTSDPVELADKHKRLILCQSCGTMRLIK